MEKNEKNKSAKNIEDGFITYDPDDLPYIKLHICEIIRDLPELTPEEIGNFLKE